MKVQEAVLLMPSVAVQVTSVTPFGNAYPGAGLQTVFTVEQLSAAVGGVKLTIAVQCPLSVLTMAGEGQVIIGGSESLTFTTNALVKLFPDESDTVQLTVVVPFRNTVPEAGKQSTLAEEQLSVNEGAA